MVQWLKTLAVAEVPILILRTLCWVTTSETPVPGDPTPSSGLCMSLQTCDIHLHRRAHTHTLLSKNKK